MTYEELVAYVGKNLKKTAAKKIENHIAVEFDIYGEAEGAFYVEVKEGAITVEPYEYYDRDAKVFVTADDLVKIIKNEKTAEESYAEGILMVEGNVDAAQELIKLVKAPAKKPAAKKPAEKAPAKKAVAKKTAAKAAKVEKKPAAKVETVEKKPAAKTETAKKTVKAEKEIVEMTKKADSKVSKDIKK